MAFACAVFKPGLQSTENFLSTLEEGGRGASICLTRAVESRCRLVGKGAQKREVDPLIAVLTSACYSALERWLDLESLVRGSSWRQLEPSRLAFLA